MVRSHAHGWEDLLLLRWQYIPNWCRFHANLMTGQNPSCLFFPKNWHTDPKIHMEIQGTKNSEIGFGKEEKVKDTQFPISKPTTKLL